MTDDRRTDEVTSETSVLLEAISVLMDWDYHPEVRATLRSVAGNGTTILTSIVALPSAETWTITYPDDSAERRDADGIYTLRLRGAVVESSPRDPRRVPPALWLIFPMTALIWGRPRDGWKMIGAVRTGNLTEISLEHVEHPDVLAQLTVDHDQRMATKFVTPFDSMELLNIG
ncbi:hypothetical protein [Cryobacterium sp. MLB-32]|uniref:hypothetical protein n=1 Tax=Cryobacterium sp. MLB-32 TaxID=1529318 RepID=UPI0012E00A27|nr:hypothetical protein [Cryobacterium sp. MLB-32]